MIKKIITVLLISFVFISCESQDHEIKQNISDFFEAVNEKNFKKARKLVTKDSEFIIDWAERSPTDSFLHAVNNMNAKELEYEKILIDGNEASILVKNQNTGQQLHYKLKKESDKWKISFDPGDVMSSLFDKLQNEGTNPTDSIDQLLNSLRKDLSPDSIPK